MRFPLLKLSQRLINILAILLLLVQTSLLLHNLEHDLHGHDEHCISCELANHQYSQPVDTTPVVLLAFNELALPGYFSFILQQHFQYFSTRAPPVSVL